MPAEPFQFFIGHGVQWELLFAPVTGGTDLLGRSVTCSYPLPGAFQARGPYLGYRVKYVQFCRFPLLLEQFGKTTLIRAGIEEFWLLG